MAALDVARITFAFAFVLIALGGGAWAARKFGLMGAGGFARKRRLALVEVLPIDQKRRAAIIRCDEKEHLVILNANSATVIAREIEAPSNPFAAATGSGAARNETAPAKETSSETENGDDFLTEFERVA